MLSTSNQHAEQPFLATEAVSVEMEMIDISQAGEKKQSNVNTKSPPMFKSEYGYEMLHDDGEQDYGKGLDKEIETKYEVVIFALLFLLLLCVVGIFFFFKRGSNQPNIEYGHNPAGVTDPHIIKQMDYLEGQMQGLMIEIKSLKSMLKKDKDASNASEMLYMLKNLDLDMKKDELTEETLLEKMKELEISEENQQKHDLDMEAKLLQNIKNTNTKLEKIQHKENWNGKNMDEYNEILENLKLLEMEMGFVQRDHKKAAEKSGGNSFHGKFRNIKHNSGDKQVKQYENKNSKNTQNLVWQKRKSFKIPDKRDTKQNHLKNQMKKQIKDEKKEGQKQSTASPVALKKKVNLSSDSELKSNLKKEKKKKIN